MNYGEGIEVEGSCVRNRYLVLYANEPSRPRGLALGRAGGNVPGSFAAGNSKVHVVKRNTLYCNLYQF
jgi:hypothetical protein